MSDYVDIRQQAPLTPTLVLGAGGTGAKVVRRVKGALEQYFADRNLGDIPPVMRFLAVDSVPLSNPPGETPLSREEYVYLGQVDGSLIVSNPRFHPEIATWWDDERNPPGHIDNGCGQMRDVGRLVFYYHYNDFLSRLTSQINAIQRQASVYATEYRGFTIRPNQLRICVVSSVAGGTGSGVFLDATYNVHHLLSRIGGITATVEGYLVLPEVFLSSLQSTAMQESVQANGYAALSEVEFLNRHPEQAKDFFHKYPGGHTINPQRRPFDHTFLVGFRDQEGFGLSSPEQAYDAIAEAIYLEAVYLDQAMTENGVNIFADSDVGGDIGDTGVGRYYSSFSVSAVSVRRDIALAYCQHRLSLDALHDLLPGHAAEEADLPASPDGLQASALTDDMGERLMNSRPLLDLLGRHEAESKPLLDILDQNERALHTWLGVAMEPLRDSARKKQRELRAYIDKGAWEIALTHGVDSVFPYLRAFVRRLQQTSEELRDRSSVLDRQSEDLHGTYEHDRTELEELALGPGLRVLLFDGTAKRRHHREQLFDDARTNLRDCYQARFKREVVRQIHSVVVHSLLGDTADNDSGSVARLIKQWEGLREIFGGVQTDVERGLDDLLHVVMRLDDARGTFAVAHALSLSRTELEALYRDIHDAFAKRDFLLAVADDIEQADPDGIDTPHHLQQEVRNLMLVRAGTICLRVFTSDGSKDSVIKGAHADVQTALSRCLGRYVSQTAVLNELFEYNVPLWSYSSVTNLQNALERTNLAAVESREPAGWQSTDPEDILSLGRGRKRLEHGAETDRIVETGDPGLLAVYRASYGLPLFLLNEIPDLREQYLRRRGLNHEVHGKKQELSLHLCSAWNNQPPVDIALDSAGGPLLAGTTD